MPSTPPSSSGSYKETALTPNGSAVTSATPVSQTQKEERYSAGHFYPPLLPALHCCVYSVTPQKLSVLIRPAVNDLIKTTVLFFISCRHYIDNLSEWGLVIHLKSKKKTKHWPYHIDSNHSIQVSVFCLIVFYHSRMVSMCLLFQSGVDIQRN